MRSVRPPRSPSPAARSRCPQESHRDRVHPHRNRPHLVGSAHCVDPTAGLVLARLGRSAVDRGASGAWRSTPSLRARPAVAALGVGEQRGLRRRALPRLRGRAHHVRRRSPLRRRPGPPARGRLRRAPGDRVAIAMRNYPEWVVAFWAATCAGAVVVPLNAWWTGPELAYGLTDSGSVVLVRRRRAGRADRAAPGETPVRARSSRAPERRLPDGGLAPPTPSATATTPPPLPPSRDRPRRRRHDHVHLGHDGPAEGRRRHPSQHHGLPDEHPLSGGDGAAAAAAARRRARPRRAAADHAAHLPLFHVGGLHTFLLPYTAAGARSC